MSIRRFRAALPLLLSLCLTPALAGASFTFDVDTLNRLLPALSASRVELAIIAEHSLLVELHEMQVVGLEPAAGGGMGRIATRLRVKVPQLGLDVPLQPKLLLEIVEREGRGELELRFDEVAISIPLAGKVDLAPLLPPLRFPATNLWTVEGAAGDVALQSRVTGVTMRGNELRFDFELETIDGGSD